MSNMDPYNKYIAIADEINLLVKKMPCCASLEKQLLIMAAKILKGYTVALCISKNDTENQHEKF